MLEILGGTVVVGVAVYFLYSYKWTFHEVQQIGKEKSTSNHPAVDRVSGSAAIERQFMNVFFNRTIHDRQRIIDHWKSKKRCGHDEAMKHAIDDWERDNRSWR